MQNGMCTTSNSRLENASNSFNMVGEYAENSMYALQEMLSTNDDYTLIKKCFEASIPNSDKANISKVYRVVKRGETSDQKSENLMLFHGTGRVNSIRILEEGFKPSIQGKHGPGVYLTESSSCAVMYSFFKSLSNSGLNDKLRFLFLNEILESEKIEEIVIEKVVTDNTANPRKNQFEKYVIRGTAQKHSDDNNEQDSNDRKLRTHAPSAEEWNNYFVCHEKFVVPRYLIQCYPKGKQEFPKEN